MNNMGAKKNMEVHDLKKKLDNLNIKQIKKDISSSSSNNNKMKKTNLNLDQMIQFRI
jgi:hypothetical protein